MQPNTNTNREYKDKIYDKLLEKFMKDPKPSEKSDPYRKNHSDPQHTCFS